MVVVCQLKRKAVVRAVIGIFIIVSRAYHNYRLHFSILYGMINDIYQYIGVFRGAEIGRFIAPSPMHQVKYIIFPVPGIAVWEIHIGSFRKLLFPTLITHGFIGLVGQPLYGSLLPCRS